MSFFVKLKKVFGGTTKKKPGVLDFIKKDQDPGEWWEIVGELGDGAFGKVYKVKSFCMQDLSGEFAVMFCILC